MGRSTTPARDFRAGTGFPAIMRAARSRKPTRRGLFVLLGALAVIGCARSEPSDPDARFEQVLADAIRANSRYADRPDSAAAARDSIIAAAGFTPETLRAYIAERQDRHAAWLALFDRLQEQFQDSVETPRHLRRPTSPRPGG